MLLSGERTHRSCSDPERRAAATAAESNVESQTVLFARTYTISRYLPFVPTCSDHATIPELSQS
jgi:hypothetical protein